MQATGERAARVFNVLGFATLAMVFSVGVTMAQTQLPFAFPKGGQNQQKQAVVVLEPGQSTDEAALLAFLKDKLARYKQPRQVFFWDELPKSGYGKVPKHLIRDELYARGDLSGEAAQ